MRLQRKDALYHSIATERIAKLRILSPPPLTSAVVTSAAVTSVATSLALCVNRHVCFTANSGGVKPIIIAGQRHGLPRVQNTHAVNAAVCYSHCLCNRQDAASLAPRPVRLEATGSVWSTFSPSSPVTRAEHEHMQNSASLIC